MTTSTRKCGGCGNRFRPEGKKFPGPVAWCSDDCALTVARKRVPAVKASQQRQERKDNKEAKDRVKKRTAWVADAQKLLNQIVVIEDAPKGCISCKEGKPVTDSGHYFHRGNKYRVSPLTLLRLNLNGQCTDCNRWEGGKAHDYMEGFIERYGEAKFLELSEYRRAVDRGEIPPLTIEQCKELIAEYKQRLKELRAS